MMELEASERLIVWAVRRWVAGLRCNDGAQWQLVGREFRRQFNGQDGIRALAGFARLIDGLQHGARRPVRLHRACYPFLSADEVHLVCFVAACQAPVSAVARVRAEWLVRLEGVGDLLQAGTQLGNLMHRHGLTLPQRTAENAGGREDTEVLVAVH